MESDYYKITHVTHFDDIELNILIGEFESTEADIQELAEQNVQTVLVENELHVIHGERHIVILLHETAKYQFERNFQLLDWNLGHAYAELKREHPEKDAFAFSSVAYGIDHVSPKELSQ